MIHDPDSIFQTFANRPIGHDDLKKVKREQNHESTAGQSISNGQLKSGINQWVSHSLLEERDAAMSSL